MRTLNAIEIALFNLRQARGRGGNTSQSDRIDGAIEALKWVGDVEYDQLNQIWNRQPITHEKEY